MKFVLIFCLYAFTIFTMFVVTYVVLQNSGEKA